MMKLLFQKISQLDKVPLEEVKEYYDSFDNKRYTPDDEFAEYIDCKKRIRK